MAWANLGSITPDGEWDSLSFRLQSRLLRLTYIGDEAYLKKFQPRAYLRFRIGSDYMHDWITIWPKDGLKEVFLFVPIAIASNYFEIRKRRDPYSSNANYSVLVEEFQAEPYLISYEAGPMTINQEPFTLGGSPVEI
ncbi:hypothetical protein [cf. Phormidesmis sp. LEGE 11477]|uniref:hypothetical protein n=1 Tax=cf. Phormidesmis sp. LEGE 11477 TaxID=1828680 RepID=UPI001880B3E2|nr:hypothetical protein [cf. Phormidesmis sp. LEGE 11477]MBE9061859.1 hypothetical protein [cf. Phormidesmis sp. LEGE 11477]